VSAAVVIAVEDANDSLLHEIANLGQKSWDECSSIKGETCAFHGERGFIIEPNFEQYLWLASQGALTVLTLRDDGELRGYAIGIVYRSLHHRPAMCGNVDTFYIEPGYRSRAAVLAKRLEDEFRSLGVSIIGWPTTRGGAIYKMLESLGYIPDDVVMEKRPCAS
jgi:hypothetical protein